MYRSNDGKLKLPRVDDVIQESDEDAQNEDSIGRVTRRSVNKKRIVIKKEIKVETDGHTLPMRLESDEFPMGNVHVTPISIKQEVYHSQNPATSTPTVTSNNVSNASENRREGDARETVLNSL